MNVAELARRGRRAQKAVDEKISALGEVKRDKDGYICCRVCGCTEREPCNPPCAWHFPDLCDSCATVVSALLIWSEGAHRADWAALRREVGTQQLFRDIEPPIGAALAVKVKRAGRA